MYIYIYIHICIYTVTYFDDFCGTSVRRSGLMSMGIGWMINGWWGSSPPKKGSLFQTCFKLQTSKFSIDSIPNFWKPSFVAYESSEWSKSLVNQVVAILEWSKPMNFCHIFGKLQITIHENQLHSGTIPRYQGFDP